jgi:Rne/Rng family ribonuclease
MAKELFVSSTPHETKVAMVEDDQLSEIYFERENEYTLAGSIYKGRVTRVLPGMQSAFVEIGLERDAFLYVSDFFEMPEGEEEDFEPVPLPRQRVEVPPAEPERHLPRTSAPPAAPPAPPAAGEEGQPFVIEGDFTSGEQEPERPPAPEPQEQQREDRPWRGRRRRGRRGRGFPESKFAQPQPEQPERPRERRDFGPPPGYQPIILPGESISKYQRLGQAQPAPAAGEASPESQPAAVAEEETRPDTSSTAPEATSPAAAQPGESESRFEQMNVAAVFGGEQAYAAAEPEEPAHPEPHHEAQAGTAPVASEPVAVSASGAMEEEEIEEDEAEMPSPVEHLDEIDFEEVEEETLEAEGGRPGSAEMTASEQLTEAVQEAGQRDALEDYESENEAEAGEAEAEAAELEEEELTRAQLRGPSGTAPFQQRAERPAFDRQRRGRRGGRRGRMRPAQRYSVMISDMVKEGQEILVQIAKEPIGKKGARITSHIALPGRFLVFMPTVQHIGVSRKISSDEERQRLKRIVMGERNGHGGFIVRTAADGVSEEELRADIRFLMNLWTEIKNRSDNAKAPALIYHDLNLVERTLRDLVTEDFSHIWVDTEQEYERVLRFVNRFQPNLVRRVRLYTKETPLFEQFGVQEEINKALKSKVWLKSGGYIVINQTEALVAIDVNTGKYVGKTSRLEDTIFKTNVDAIKEIVRQIRLRDLGGIIVIDFIDMDERKNRQRVTQALEEALTHDRAPSKVLAFNDFGLVAITRKRVKHSLERTLCTPCAYCSGTGLVKAVETVCNEIYIEMRKLLRRFEGKEILLRVNPEVAKALKANNARWLTEMEEMVGKSIVVKSDPLLHQEQFDM